MSLGDLFIKMARDVEEFQNKVTGVQTPFSPTMLTQERKDTRYNHFREEDDEFAAALTWDDTVDALIDGIYIRFGTLLEMGAHPQMSWDAVQKANMKRERGMSKRGNSNDAVKPEGWQPPDHRAIFEMLELLGQVSPAFVEATRIKLERGAKYNKGTVQRKDHFPFGHAGHAAIAWIKMIRIRSEVEGGDVNNEDMSEHLRDLMNYLSFWWEEMNGGIRP